ncbi:MAG: hypothetical protein WC314_15165 [Vulcanimicrobiota bacterium]
MMVLFPLLLLPLASIFVFAGKGGWSSFVAALMTEDALFAIRFSILVALITSLINGLLGTFASQWQTFRQVILPALKGGLFSGSLLTFAHSLGEFGATVMVSGNLRLKTQTAPLYIFAQFEAGNIETANAVAAVLAVFSFALFYLLLRFTGGKRRT